ncbi:MAG: endo alpha-1,4 polygalactosaminidase [SAR324 cluster bacterium]|nr:endo alpha-1,4 polygalactosaminidase [SAR324 cluster bacterium]
MISCKTVSPEWICYYGNDALTTTALGNVNLVVLDDQTKVDVPKIRRSVEHVLGYLSIGEVDTEREYFSELPDTSFLLEYNPNWDKSRIVDIRSEKWQEWLLNVRIPHILRRGFNGLFLDTMDSVIYMEQTNPERKGMVEASIRLVQRIKQQFPEIYIMVNRGVEAAPQYGPYVDAILAESFFADYNFTDKTYELRPIEDAKEYVGILTNVKKDHGVALFGLDYWYPDDKKNIRLIYEIQKKHGFIPYVATVELDQIVYP